MKYFVMFLIFGLLAAGSIMFAQSQKTEQYVPYTENKNVEFTDGGKINYDLLIAKIMPEIFEKKFHDMGIDVSKEDIVLISGFQILIYEPHSYNCGFVVNQEKTQVYWLEAAINSTHIQYANIYDEIPREETSVGFFVDCFALIEAQAAEALLDEKSFFTDFEEKHAAAIVKHHVRGNENLNKYQVTVGKFNYDFGNENNISICGEFVGRNLGSSYYLAVSYASGDLHFSLEQKMSSLCAIDENPVLYDIKFKENSDLDKSLQTWKNSRMETVHVKHTSVEKLLERNYFYVDSINHSILHYASHLILEHVDYQPENSSTVLKFTPSEKDSYMKIRLRDTGVSYYQSYGSEDWNVGELLGLSILVDGTETSYSQFSYVKSPQAPYPQYYTDSIFKIPANSTYVDITLDIENYNLDEENPDWKWRDYSIRK
ncbi:hypothetical protein [Nitrosopumilus sp. b2]|uniref:hypothetical protein n=1 Tax=Nitrosopumilus sp. b2 TaxID=2109908 RepID=UPI0015F648C0|nr:hypothetical protein [Nitrosopumilus sp. b2]KAF6245079.1 hypothetical protein C6989_05150 [Nitrosopumilus sp. b2]